MELHETDLIYYNPYYYNISFIIKIKTYVKRVTTFAFI